MGKNLPQHTLPALCTIPVSYQFTWWSGKTGDLKYSPRVDMIFISTQIPIDAVNALH
jgi:hypothetical protein